MNWPVPSWPKPIPPEPRLAALIDAVDRHLCGLSSKDDLRRAWREAVRAH